MWQQMLILMMLGWIVDASAIPTVKVSSTKLEISSPVLPNTKNDSVDSVDIDKEDSVLEEVQRNITRNDTESSKPTNSSEIFQVHQSESNSAVHENDTPKVNITESPATSVGKDDVSKENEVSNSSIVVKESNSERTVPDDNPDKANNIQDKDSVPNTTDGQSDESNNQKEDENRIGQSSVKENVHGNISNVVSDPKVSSAPESSRSPDSFVTVPPNATSTSTTTVAVKVNNEGSVESPFQVMDEINTGETGSQSSEINEIPASDENYDKVDLLEGKEDFAEKTIIDNGGKFSDDEDSHFFAYFLTIMVTAIIFYLIFHNKQRIIALIIEGRAPNNRGRRLSRKVRYHKLDNNLEEAITATKGAKYDRIY